MVKASTKASVKTKKNKSSTRVLLTQQENESPKVELPPVEEKDYSEITITLQSYHNVTANYPSSYISAKCQYASTDLGETAQILMTDDPIITVDHQFKIKCDAKSAEDLDRLVANPVIIKIFEFPNTESTLFIQDPDKADADKLVLEENSSPIESTISLYEALTGDVVEVVDATGSERQKKKIKAQVKKDKNGKKGSKTSRKSKESEGKPSKASSKAGKISRKSSDKKSSKESSKKESSKEALKKLKEEIKLSITEVGVCIVDLLPLILGNSSFSEFIAIIAPEVYCDDRMVRHSQQPGMYVTISINKPLSFASKPNLLNLTIESIYNIPLIMNDKLEYDVCLMLPSVNQRQQPVIIKNGQYTTTSTKPTHTKWSEVSQDYFNVTGYNTDFDPDTIKNYVDNGDLQDVFNDGNPRIQFNSLKRNILLKEGFLALYDQIRKFRNVVLEIYASQKITPEIMERALKPNSKIKTKAVNTSNLTKEEKKEKLTNYLHLMAIIDLSPLLYPGVTKLRITAPVSTFHEQEALISGGLQNSYFIPSKPKTSSEETTQKQQTKATTKKKRSESKSSKSSKSGKKSKKSKTSKEGKKSKGTIKDKKSDKDEKDLDMKKMLPPKPSPEPVPEPSVTVYNETGKPTFIFLEIELTEPLLQKKDIADLHGSLKELVQTKPKTPKIVVDDELIKEFYRKIIKEVIITINRYYATYKEKKNQCHCDNQGNFITYLKRAGSYQGLVFAMAQIASLAAQSKLDMLSTRQLQHQYQSLVQEILMHLITEINQALHKVTTISRSFIEIPNSSAQSLLFYAKEAAAIGNLDLAEKYYLKRLHYNSNNPNHWFDYAVFKLYCNELEKSFMCLQEALAKNLYHKNSLLLSGILLAEKKRLKEAELCLISLMVHEPRWVEGWVVLYLFYKETDDTGGMDLSVEMALKYLDDPPHPDNTFITGEDLAWTSHICPNTLFLRTAVTLLKMKTYSWVENALACEVKETGIVHYLLAAICYYKHKYNHALQHLERARYFHGSDYAVVSLTGHCYMALGEHKKALEEYLHVLSSFERPEDTHLLYLNCAKIMNNSQEARKLLLMACKHYPTPFTWLCCGIAYFEQKDFISAEECFSESVILDNTIADCWGYLALTNLKMKRCSEAEICFRLALKNNLTNEFLHEEVKKEFEKL